MESTVAPTTTTEQNLRSAGQRQINLIWERTQQYIAIALVTATIIHAFVLLFLTNPPPSTILANAFFLVIGFYFGRTNHARIGDDPKSAAMDDRF